MKLLFALVLLVPTMLAGQLMTAEIRHNHSSANTRTTDTEEDPVLTIPLWDDFSNSSSVPDPEKWKIGANIFVNETMAKNAPTYKVATFDGLSGGGQAYTQEISFPGPADSLITHAIDLSGIATSKRNTVFFSFFWQANGFGELPDEEDSLSVQFLANDSTWITTWSTNGGLNNEHENFKQEIIPVADSRFYHSNFRIKFQSFINRGGPYDTWHIDYIYLNQNRNINDTLHFDRGLSGTITLLFSPYYEVPSHQFFNNPAKYLTSQSLYANNLDNSPHPLDFYYKLSNLTSGSIYIDSAMGNGGLGALLPLEYRMLNGPDIIDLPTNNLDSQVIESRFYYNTNDKFLFEEVIGDDTTFLPVDLKINDTIRHRYTLHQHYAYDDGTAEYAAGINLLRGKVAIRYAIEEPDTLTRIDIHIPDIIPNPNGKSIDLIVWNELSEAGELRRQPYPIQLSGKDQFTSIPLNTPVIVTDTFYVGYQQYTDNFIGIGFDRNNPLASEHIFYQTSEVWEQNDRISGAMMIRPVFQSNSEYVLDVPKVSSDFSFYPNPSTGTIYVNQSFDHLHVFDISGRLQFTSEYQKNIDLSFLEDGIYLLKFMLKNEGLITSKVIIRH